jgi:hypothetical protein
MFLRTDEKIRGGAGSQSSPASPGVSGEASIAIVRVAPAPTGAPAAAATVRDLNALSPPAPR